MSTFDRFATAAKQQVRNGGYKQNQQPVTAQQTATIQIPKATGQQSEAYRQNLSSFSSRPGSTYSTRSVLSDIQDIA